MRYLIFDLTINKNRPTTKFYHAKQLIYVYDNKYDLHNEIQRLLRYDKRVFQVVDTQEYKKTTYTVHSHVNHDVEEGTFKPLSKYMFYYIHFNSKENKQGFTVADYATNSEIEYTEKLRQLTKSDKYEGFILWNTKENTLKEYRQNKNKTKLTRLFPIYEGSLFDYRLRTELKVLETVRYASQVDNCKPKKLHTKEELEQKTTQQLVHTVN